MSMNTVSPPIPSRHANPFATCWTRPGRIAWLSTADIDPATIVQRFDQAGSGQLVGPHGAGKSTLLAAVCDRLQARGEHVLQWRLNRQSRPAPRPRLVAGAVLLVDGWEQLGPVTAWQLRTACRWWRVRLLATTHEPTRLPLLARLEPTQEDMLALFAQLTHHRPSPVTAQDAAASYHRCHGNLRDVWFDLYDRHEWLTHNKRTVFGGAT